MSKSAFLITIVGTLLFIFIGFSLYSLEWEKIEREVGFNDAAQKDPLIAAKSFLATKQVEFKKLNQTDDFLRHRAITLNQNGSFIVDEAALVEHHHFEKALLAWTESGGHLIYLVSPRRNSLEIDNNLILKTLGISITEPDNLAYRANMFDEPSANIEYEQFENEYLRWYLPYQFQFENCQGQALNVKDSSEVLICEQALGSGFVTFITSIQPFSNASLRHLDHGELLLWLVGSHDYLWYLPSVNAPNWLVSLWQWSSLFVSLFILFTIVIMWRLSVRFGPAKTPHFSERNLFAEHIQAVGNFIVRQGHYSHLKTVLIKDIEHVMEVRNPRFKQLSLDQQSLLLSQLSGMNQQLIIQIFSEDLPENDNERFHYIKLFKQLRNAL